LTLGDFENREVKLAQQVAAERNCSFFFIQRDQDYYLRLLEDAVDIGDGKFRFDHAHFLGVEKEISQHCDVILNGYGFDVYLKDYFLMQKSIDLFGKSIPLPLIDSRKTGSKPLGLQHLSYSGMNDLNPIFRSTLSKKYKDYFCGDESVLSAMTSSQAIGIKALENQYSEYMDNLFLDCSVWNFEAFLCAVSLRSRFPERTLILDNEMFDLSFYMPYMLRLYGRGMMKVLQRLAPDLARIPFANIGHKPGFNPWLQWGVLVFQTVLKKLGIITPPEFSCPYYTNSSWPDFAHLIRFNPGLSNLIKQNLFDPAAIDPDIFDVGFLESALQQHLSGVNDFTHLLLSLLTFGSWYRKYGPNNG